MHPTAGIDASNYVATFDKAFNFTVIVSLIFIIGLTMTCSILFTGTTKRGIKQQPR